MHHHTWLKILIFINIHYKIMYHFSHSKLKMTFHRTSKMQHCQRTPTGAPENTVHRVSVCVQSRRRINWAVIQEVTCTSELGSPPSPKLFPSMSPGSELHIVALQLLCPAFLFFLLIPQIFSQALPSPLLKM